jgi:hypothetical protein
MVPLEGSTLIRSLVALRESPVDLLKPEYIQVFVKFPQFTVAEKGVIGRN